MSISLCTFIKNESQNVEQMLRSCIPYVDEINVIDTGSTDDTLDIVENLSSEFKHIPFNIGKIVLSEIRDFSALRNVCISMATKDWILMMDGDELFASSPDAIKFVTEQDTYDLVSIWRKNLCSDDWDIPPHLAGRIKRDNIPGSRFFGTKYFDEYQRRLIRNNGKILYTNTVHEEPIGWKNQLETRALYIDHLCFLTKSHLKRHNNNLLYAKLLENRRNN